MKNHRFLWLRNRTTDNRKCEKARNIKEKRTIEMFNTVSKLHVVLHSSANVNKEIIFQERRYQEKPIFQGLQKLWNAVRCAGIYIECNTYAAGMQQRY